MFKDLKSKIENFYNMSDIESDSFLKELNIRMNKEPDRYKEFMNKIGYGIESNRSIFYEAMTQVNPNPWSKYIFEELQILIRKAENGNIDAIHELSSIHLLTDIPGMEKEFYYTTKEFLMTKLKSRIAQIRELSLTAIFDVIHHLNEQPNQNESIQLIECLNDSNFKNKVFAYSELKEAKLVPKDFKFTRIERLRIKLQGYTNLIE